MKSKKELDTELCDYCPFTKEGPTNTGPWNLCEGRACDEAYENYKEEYERSEEDE